MPTPPNVEVPDIYVSPDITVSPTGEIVLISEVYSERYSEELVNIAMRNKDYPYAVRNITAGHIQNGVWIVTVTFNSFELKSKQYIFDEVNP